MNATGAVLVGRRIAEQADHYKVIITACRSSCSAAATLRCWRGPGARSWVVRVPPPERVRAASLLREWGDRGLSRGEASALFRKHGFAPQTAGGWARSAWIETRPDGRRYVTESSRRWLAGQEDADGDG